MSQHVSWRAGGIAQRFYVPLNRDDLSRFVSQETQSDFHVIGLGSNLLVRDGGLTETIIQMHGALKEIQVVEQRPNELILEVEAGVPAPKIARWVAKLGYQGGEFLAGIPGTLGGALAMNAGCYGKETWQCVESVITMDDQGSFFERNNSEYEIGYRHVALKPPVGQRTVSRLHPTQEWFIAARLKFINDPLKKGQQLIKELLARRVATQPLGQPNAGSVFRNPPGGFAAQLIEKSGLKGVREGGAEVSYKHANFIVNVGGATAADIENLIYRVQQRVWEVCGISLTPEVRIIGNRLG
ncbi:MAG: UDP-N-acetylmuramate dehydrogenase [Betaproteobacteria bacterium]|nr:UDP-N-acetylmuramate dehydrogenase [Betaproteobacteria bacterium]MDE2055659.1 UDP-N-acetylmuramate dehydrogenase [Betaproteobacteria bacterium]